MVKYLNSFLGCIVVPLGITAQSTLFFSVYTHDRIAWALIRLLELINGLKLGLKLLIVMFSLSCFQYLHCIGFRKVVFLQ
jgi:hypothetical protein